MTGNALEETANLTVTEPRAGQFAIGVVGLNNPWALNALTLAMFQALERKLLEWRGRMASRPGSNKSSRPTA
jgi:enoyl-CoA hydratase/carnithine racemase